MCVLRKVRGGSDALDAVHGATIEGTQRCPCAVERDGDRELAFGRDGVAEWLNVRRLARVDRE